MKKKLVRMVVQVPEDFHRILKHEAIDKKITLGELIQEAFASRITLIKRDNTK